MMTKSEASRDAQPAAAPETPPIEPIDIRVAAIRLHDFLTALPGLFQTELLGDAALKMLLDLFIAELDRKRLPIKSVCIGSGIPQSTALRYIERLEGAGLIRRHANPADRRSAHIALMPATSQALRLVLVGLFADRRR